MTEKQKEYYKKYYATHKEQILENNKRWRENNKKKFSKSVYKYRKKVAEERKARGEKYNWLSNVKRSEIYECNRKDDDKE